MVKKQENTKILYWVIAFLIIVIVWFLGYFLWRNNANYTPLIVEAWNIWVDKEELQECINDNKYLDKINSQMKVWIDNFGITWTPWNVLINNETLEYEIISWAYPKESFITLIDKLLSDKVIAKEDSKDKKDFKKNKDKNTVIIISDKRDSTTPIEQIVWSLKQMEAIKNMKIENYDFSDNGVSEYLEENEIKTLPAIVFVKDKLDSKINNFLIKLKDNSYSLNIWAKFNPFVKLSPKWFKIIDKNLIEQIKKDSYIDWNENAKITWLEYSDLECPFCAKLHNSDVESTLKTKYGNDLNIIFNHFPLDFHKKAIPWAQILECVWKQWWSEAFYKIMRYAYKNKIQE